MATSWREYQSYLYLFLMALGVVLLLITVNDLIIKNTGVIESGFTLQAMGAWESWLFAIAIVMAATFAYYFVRVTSQTRKFHELIDSSSKHAFVKNLRELQRIARNLGPSYEARLQESMNKWKVK